jgi:hypothetical protein
MCVLRNKYLHLRARVRKLHAATRGVIFSVMLARQRQLVAAALVVQVRAGGGGGCGCGGGGGGRGGGRGGVVCRWRGLTGGSWSVWKRGGHGLGG